MTRVYVGDLSFQTSSTDLEDVFGEFRDASKASIVSDRESGCSKGFAEMPNNGDAQSAISALNGQDQDGRNLKVDVAKPREQRTRTCWQLPADGLEIELFRERTSALFGWRGTESSARFHVSRFKIVI